MAENECPHPWRAIEITVMEDLKGIITICRDCMSILPKPLMEWTTLGQFMDETRVAVEASS